MSSRKKRKHREAEEEKAPPRIEQDKRMKDSDERGERRKREREDYEQQRQIAKIELEEAKKELMGIEEKRDLAEKKRDKLLDLFIKETDPSVRDLYKRAVDEAELALENAEASLRTVQSAIETQQNAVNRLTELTLPPSPNSSPSSGSYGRPRGKRLRGGVSEASESVQEFWNLLGDAVLKENALELKNGTCFLGEEKLGSKLFIREHYEKILKRIRSLADDRLTRSTILGTPGIGKTYFLYWLLWKLRLENVPVVLFETAGEIYKFSSSGDDVVLRSVDYSTFFHALDQKDTWYLVDGVRPFFHCKGITVLATSPRRKNWYDFSKQELSVRIFMPLFTLEELLECQRICFPDLVDGSDTIKQRFDTYGGMVRAVLSMPSTKHKELMSLFDEGSKIIPPEFDPESLLRLGNTFGKEDNKIVHRVIHIDVTDLDEYTTFEYKFASRMVTKQVVEQFWRGQDKKVRDFVKSARQPTMAQIRGLAFEQLGHDVLCQGGEFHVRDLETGDVSVEDWPRRELQYFGKLEEIPAIIGADKYALPNYGTLTAVDSIVRGSANQITVSLDHPLKADGVKAIMDVTDIDRLVFVVPSDKYMEFGKQRYEPKKGKRVAKKVKELEQWVLEIPLI